MILVDLTTSMKDKIRGTEKWNMTLDIVTRFLETLSEDDAVQIVGLKSEPEVLMGPDRTMPATEQTVERLTNRLKGWEPDEGDSVADIGKAIDRAMDLLHANKDPRNTKCENVSHCLLSFSR